MKKCAVCGTECAADASTCGFCGESSFDVVVEVEPARKASKPAKSAVDK